MDRLCDKESHTRNYFTVPFWTGDLRSMNGLKHSDLDIHSWENGYANDLVSVYVTFFQNNKMVPCTYTEFVLFCYHSSTRIAPPASMDPCFEDRQFNPTSDEIKKEQKYACSQSDQDKYSDLFYELYSAIDDFRTENVLFILGELKFYNFLGFCLHYANPKYIDNHCHDKVTRDKDDFSDSENTEDDSSTESVEKEATSKDAE